MKKRIVAVLMAAAMTMGLMACGSSTSTSGDAAASSTGNSESAAPTAEATAEATGPYDQVTFAYCTFNNIPTEEDLDVVEEQINVITREKIHAEITLMPISIAEYSSKVSLALQGGEKIDCFQSLGDFGNAISTEMCLDITDLYDQYCDATAKTIPGPWLDACMSNGRLYGIPTYKPVALTPMVIYREDLAQKAGVDMTAVNSLEDLTPVLEKVKAACPEITPLAPVQTGTLGTEFTMKEIDYLCDDYYHPIGALIGDNFDVVDLYDSDEFRNLCATSREWYQKGLVMKDAATTTSMAAELMASGNYFCYVAAYSYPEKDTALSLQAQLGTNPIGAKIIGDAYLSTTDINALTWMVSSTSDVPEAAIKFLDLTMTDENIINLVIYGIDGRDYVTLDDGSILYPEGQDASTVPYTAALSCGTFGNFFLMKSMTGYNKDSLEWELEQNQSAKTSPAMGFTFDSSALTTQYTAVNNVIAQYLPGLLCGSLDPETEIDAFIKALNDSGYKEILGAKQQQLNAWAGR